MCKPRNKLERDASMLAQMMMYQWRSQQAGQQGKCYEQEVSYSEYVARNIGGSMPFSNNNTPAATPTGIEDDSIGGGQEAAAVSPTIEGEEEIGSQVAEEEEEFIKKAVRELGTLGDDIDTGLQSLGLAKELGPAVEEMGYQEYKQHVVGLIKKCSCSGVVQALAVVAKLTFALSAVMAENSQGSPLSPQLEAKVIKYTEDLIVHVSQSMGMSIDTPLVSEINAAQISAV